MCLSIIYATKSMICALELLPGMTATSGMYLRCFSTGCTSTDESAKQQPSVHKTLLTSSEVVQRPAPKMKCTHAPSQKDAISSD